MHRLCEIKKCWCFKSQYFGLICYTATNNTRVKEKSLPEIKNNKHDRMSENKQSIKLRNLQDSQNRIRGTNESLRLQCQPGHKSLSFQAEGLAGRKYWASCMRLGMQKTILPMKVKYLTPQTGQWVWPGNLAFTQTRKRLICKGFKLSS